MYLVSGHRQETHLRFQTGPSWGNLDVNPESEWREQENNSIKAMFPKLWYSTWFFFNMIFDDIWMKSFIHNS